MLLLAIAGVLIYRAGLWWGGCVAAVSPLGVGVAAGLASRLTYDNREMIFSLAGAVMGGVGISVAVWTALPLFEACCMGIAAALAGGFAGLWAGEWVNNRLEQRRYDSEIPSKKW